MRRSGLIVPKGEAKEADLVVNLREPVIGQAGKFTKVKFVARFVPASGGEQATPAKGEGKKVTVDEQKMIFGYPALWVYGAAGVLALILLLLLILLLRRGGAAQEEDVPAPVGGGDDDFDFDDPGKTTPIRVRGDVPPEPKAAILGYLVREDTGERIAIRSSKVSLGRSASNDVSINHASISRTHADLVRTSDGRFEVRDKGSLNSSKINGKKFTGAGSIGAGDVLTLGQVGLRLVSA